LKKKSNQFKNHENVKTKINLFLFNKIFDVSEFAPRHPSLSFGNLALQQLAPNINTNDKITDKAKATS
jgi:hypothetical protein